jgi:hypothetical protein
MEIAGRQRLPIRPFIGNPTCGAQGRLVVVFMVALSEEP